MLPFVSAMVLAAGISKRIGMAKQVLPLGATTIIERTVDNILVSAVGEVIVVLGDKSDQVMHFIGDGQVTVVVDRDYFSGRLRSEVGYFSAHPKIFLPK